MPRAFLIKKHSTSHTSKRTSAKIVRRQDDDGFHLTAAKDYVKSSLVSDSGSETCSTPSASPSPQPCCHPHHPEQQWHGYRLLKDVDSSRAAAEWVARSSSSLDAYCRASVLEPLNMNANSHQAASSIPAAAWIHAPLYPSYLPLYYSTLGHNGSSSALQYGRPSGDSVVYYGHPSRTSERSPSPPSDTTKDEDSGSDVCVTANDHQAQVAAIDMQVHVDDEDRRRSAAAAAATATVKGSDVAVPRRRGGGAEGPRYSCPDCNKSYSTHSGLSKHQQFHCATNNKRSFSCKYCDKQYVSLGALKMHIRTHTLPCKCKLCGKAFSRPWLLQGHIRTHTGEKPFSCPHCSRAFADRSNLRAHLQTHADVKKYSCKACAKTFSRMSLLLKHEDGGCGVAYDCHS